jgi:hypothetical protein
LAKGVANPDLIDRHIDLKRRVRALETMKLGRDATYAARSQHPYPIAEALCLGSAMDQRSFSAGQVARWLHVREQAVTDNNLHRLWRVLREALYINRKIGRQSTLDGLGHPNGLMYQQIPGVMPPWTGDLTGLKGGTPGAPRAQKGQTFYTQYGNWVYPWILPGFPKIRKHISKVDLTHDHYRYPNADFSDGLIWDSIQIKWMFWPADKPWGVANDQYFPVDSWVLVNGNDLTVHEFGYNRGQSYFWAPAPAPPHPLIVVETADVFFGEGPDHLELDTQDGILYSLPHTDRATPARSVQPDDWYSEDSIGYETRAYFFPADQLKSGGRPFVVGDGPAPTNVYAGDNSTDPFVQADFAYVAEWHYTALGFAEMAPLLAWYEAELSEVPAGEWLADANAQTLEPMRTLDQYTAYDHVWTPIKVDGGVSGAPYFSLGTGEGSWMIRNGIVHLRGFMKANTLQMIGDALPAYSQSIVLIGASGATYHTYVGGGSGNIQNPNSLGEAFMRLDGVFYHLN